MADTQRDDLSMQAIFTAGSRRTAKSANDDLAGLQQQLLDVAIYAGALRAHIAQPLPPPDRTLLIDQLARAEATRKALEQHITAIERLRAPWWRRWRR